MNLAHRLAMIVSEKLKLRARSEKPGLLEPGAGIFLSSIGTKHTLRDKPRCAALSMGYLAS